MEARLLKQKMEGPEVKKPNLTGIPTQMKLNFEQRSGLSFDDVRVHYSSDKPARLGALAYTQGNEVYMGPGQERHLSHELGHVVQQKAGRVRPTGWIGGLPLNDQPELEREADRAPVQCMPAPGGQDVVQRQPDPEEEEEEDVGQAVLPFGDSSAWYGSIHDGYVGSMYLEHGRLRLIHDFGPEAEQTKDEAKHTDVVRYLILSDNDDLVNLVANQLIKLYDTGAAPAIDSMQTILGCSVYPLSDSASLARLGLSPEEMAAARLFEIYLSDGECRADHMSRGGIAQLPPKWTDPTQGSKENLSALTYAVSIAELVSKQMAQCYKNIIPNILINSPEAASNLSQTGILVATRIINSAYSDQQSEIADKLLGEINQVMSEETMRNAIEVSIYEDYEEYDYRPLRFGGFLGNKILRASNLLTLENLGFAVDPEESD